MFRRRSYSVKIRYRITIDKRMCPNPVDIIADDKTLLSNATESYYDIYTSDRISSIYIKGIIIDRNPTYENMKIVNYYGGVIDGELVYQYNSGTHCDLATQVEYGRKMHSYEPKTMINNPGEYINFTYIEKITIIDRTSYVLSWMREPMTSTNCVRTDICPNCSFYITSNTNLGSYQVGIRTTQ